jgi:hypothetical protein
VNPYFPPVMLAIMEQVSEQVSTDDAVVTRASTVAEDDGMGGEMPADPEVVYANVPVRVGPLREDSREQLLADTLQDTNLEVMVTPLGLNILTNYTIQIGTSFYEVKGIVPLPTAAFEQHFLVKQVG